MFFFSLAHTHAQKKQKRIDQYSHFVRGRTSSFFVARPNCVMLNFFLLCPCDEPMRAMCVHADETSFSVHANVPVKMR